MMNNKILVVFDTDYKEYDIMEIIDESLLTELLFVGNICYHNATPKVTTNIQSLMCNSMNENDYFRNELEMLCFGRDEYSFKDINVAYLKDCLIKLGKYYNTDIYFNYEKIYKKDGDIKCI